MILVEKIVDTWIDEPLGYKYRVQVVRDRAPNAIAVPAGNIYVSERVNQQIRKNG